MGNRVPPVTQSTDPPCHPVKEEGLFHASVEHGRPASAEQPALLVFSPRNRLDILIDLDGARLRVDYQGHCPIRGGEDIEWSQPRPPRVRQCGYGWGFIIRTRFYTHSLLRWWRSTFGYAETSFDLTDNNSFHDRR